MWAAKSLQRAMTEPTSIASLLACPIDGKALQRLGNSYRCSAGHSYDCARQGYVNLLPVQQKKSKSPGDSLAMIEARARFLQSGVYADIAELLLQACLTNTNNAASVIADAACGEGYYLDYIASGLHETHQFFGWDISKEAVVAACRRNKSIKWSVATSVAAPLVDSAADILMSVFGFQHFASFARVLKPGGTLLLLEPGLDHLIELRERIYPEVRRKQSGAVEQACANGFVLQEEKQLRFTTPALSQQQLDDLLTMTPHLYRASRDAIATLKGWCVPLTVDVRLSVLALSR